MTPSDRDPIKITDERAREIIAWQPEMRGLDIDEIRALAQAVVDLRTANTILMACCQDEDTAE